MPRASASRRPLSQRRRSSRHLRRNQPREMLAFAIYQGITERWLPTTYRPTPTACAQPPAPGWTNTASSKAPAAPPTSTVPASPLKPSPSASSWSQLDSRSNRSVGQALINKNHKSLCHLERSAAKSKDLRLLLLGIHSICCTFQIGGLYVIPSLAQINPGRI